MSLGQFAGSIKITINRLWRTT